MKVRSLSSILSLFAALMFADTVTAQRPLPGPTTPTAQPQPQADQAPWANKLFLAGIKNNPGQAAPKALAYNFGTVPHGTIATQKFIITNIYDVPIQVVDIRKECGCLSAYPPQKVLQPNEEAEFVVTMNTGIFQQAGEIQKTLYITFGPTYYSTAVIQFKVTSRKDITLLPGEVNFGIVGQGEKKTASVQIKYSGNAPDWKITNYVPPTGPVEVEVKAGPNPREYTATVTLKSSAAAGHVNESIALKTNDPTFPTFNIMVNAQVQAPVTAVPDSLKVKEVVKVGTEKTFRVMLRAATPFTVEPFADPTAGISAKSSLPIAAPIQNVEITFKPTQAGRVTRDIKLKTNFGGGVVVTLPFDVEAGN